MSNELPQAPTEMCEPVITGSNYVGQKMSVKDLKLISKLYFGYYRVGRIKRMRNPKKMQDYFRGKSIRLKAVKDKYHIWELLWLQNCAKYFYPITRWNRH
jgi:hypothetical protein